MEVEGWLDDDDRGMEIEGWGDHDDGMEVEGWVDIDGGMGWRWRDDDRGMMEGWRDDDGGMEVMMDGALSEPVFPPSPPQERAHPPLLSADMEPLYVEELRSAVSLLMANLESLPVTRAGGSDLRHRLKRPSASSSFLELGDEGDTLSKSDVALSFTLEVNSHTSPEPRAVALKHTAGPEFPKLDNESRFSVDLNTLFIRIFN